MSEEKAENSNEKLLGLALAAVIAIGGVTFSLVLNRMDKQEMRAAADISALREEIKATKADAKDAASALRDSVSATALAAKESVQASAAALRDAVAATGSSAKDAVEKTAANLTAQIQSLNLRVEKIEDRSFSGSLGVTPQSAISNQNTK